MNKTTLTIKHAIQPREDNNVVFYQWIPENTSDEILIDKDGAIIRIWVERNCVNSLSDVTDETISSHIDNRINKIYVEVEFCDIDENLSEFIYGERDRPKRIHHGITPKDPDYESLSKEYEELGQEMMRLAISSYNRVISYARNIKGQSWLKEIQFEDGWQEQLANRYHAEVKINKDDWFRWCPPGDFSITFTALDERRIIRKEECGEVRKFVLEDGKPPLAYELLANAHYLLSQEHRESAIIEAIAALEVALNMFGKKPNPDHLQNSFETKNLQKRKIYAVINSILPQIFSTEILSPDILRKCKEAIVLRNKVVHNRQRGVSLEKAEPLIQALEECCKILIAHTDE